MSDFTPSKDFIRQQFNTYVRDQVFGAARAPETGRPVFVFLGGQPAAGKSLAQRMITERNPQASLVPITGDKFREFHPDFDNLTLLDPLQMPNVTSSVSGPLVRECLNYAKEQGYSVLLEGTFVNEEMVLATAEEFALAGYDIEVCAVAVSEDVSRLYAEERYLEAVAEPRTARWTPPAAHDLAVAKSPGTVAALEASPHVKRVEVWTRAERIYVNERGGDGQWGWNPGAAQAMLNERARPIAQPQEWLRLFEKNAGRAESHQVHHGPGTKAGPYLADDRVFGAWQRIAMAAEHIAAVAVPNPQDPQRAQFSTLIEAHTEQFKAARVEDPSPDLSTGPQPSVSQGSEPTQTDSDRATSHPDAPAVLRAAFPASSRSAVQASGNLGTGSRPAYQRGDQDRGVQR